VIADQREVLADKSIARLFSGEKQHKVRASELSVFFVLVEKSPEDVHGSRRMLA
jgi:hypothetical protein